MALGCLAWATPGFSYSLETSDAATPGTTGPYADHVKAHKTLSMVIQPIGITIQYMHHDRVGFTSGLLDVAAALHEDDCLIVSGHKHEEPDFESTQQLIDSLAMVKQLVLTELLPNHFAPGDKHSEFQTHFNQSDAVGVNPNGCSSVTEGANCTRAARANRAMAMAVQMAARPGLSLLQVHDIYVTRGDAHVGAHGNDQLDCLHWCYLPGVLDALAQATLGGLFEVTQAVEPLVSSPIVSVAEEADYKADCEWRYGVHITSGPQVNENAKRARRRQPRKSTNVFIARVGFVVGGLAVLAYLASVRWGRYSPAECPRPAGRPRGRSVN